jgi:hypothetical protein
MSLKKLADETVAALDEALTDHDLSDEQRQKLLEIIQQTLIKSVDQAASAHHEATKKCCGPESDMAHQIREEVTTAYELLTSNMSSMR